MFNVLIYNRSYALQAQAYPNCGIVVKLYMNPKHLHANMTNIDGRLWTTIEAGVSRCDSSIICSYLLSVMCFVMNIVIYVCLYISVNISGFILFGAITPDIEYLGCKRTLCEKCASFLIPLCLFQKRVEVFNSQSLAIRIVVFVYVCVRVCACKSIFCSSHLRDFLVNVFI